MPAPPPPAAPVRITILLCTWNGATHLEAQLASYLAQEGAAWDLWISDDGSTDGTRAILQRFREAHGADRQIRLIDGPGRGASANFLSLLGHPDLPDGPVALSDQDDVWMPHKLARALAGLARAGDMAIYSAQSLHTDAGLRVVGQSQPPRRPPSFANALVQNVVSGHSLALSAGARRLAVRAGVPRVPYHDWWLYQLVSGAGGRVEIDPEPVLWYRQHALNAMGAHQGARATALRMGQVLGRSYAGWTAENAAALAVAGDLLTTGNRQLLTDFLSLPGSGPGRAAGLARLGVHRQSRTATAGLWLAAMFGRV